MAYRAAHSSQRCTITRTYTYMHNRCGHHGRRIRSHTRTTGSVLAVSIALHPYSSSSSSSRDEGMKTKRKIMKNKFCGRGWRDLGSTLYSSWLGRGNGVLFRSLKTGQRKQCCWKSWNAIVVPIGFLTCFMTKNDI